MKRFSKLVLVAVFTTLVVGSGGYLKPKENKALVAAIPLLFLVGGYVLSQTSWGQDHGY